MKNKSNNMHFEADGFFFISDSIFYCVSWISEKGRTKK